MVQSLFIECFQAVELTLEILQFAKINNMVAYSRYKFYIISGKDMYLFYKCIPERIVSIVSCGTALSLLSYNKNHHNCSNHDNTAADADRNNPAI